MKRLFLITFSLHLAIGSICMMPIASAHTMNDDMSVQMMSDAHCADCGADQTQKQQMPCDGHCLSSTMITTSNPPSFVVQELPTVPVFSVQVTFLETEYRSPAEPNPSPPPLAVTENIVLRL